MFDAYGTLFDVGSAASHCRDALGDRWEELSTRWRDKQLQYTWLRSLMGEYVSFWRITEDALDYALASLNIDDAALRGKLLEIYFRLDAYPEVPGVLAALKRNGIRVATLSNGSPEMLNAAVDNAGLTLDAVISVERVGVFKPDGRVYQMACDDFATTAPRICFMSSNAWDAWGAAHFGFQVVWVNRFGQPPENLPGRIRETIADLTTLPALLGVH